MTVAPPLSRFWGQTLDAFIPEFYKKSAGTTRFLTTLTDTMIMIIELGNIRVVFAFLPDPNTFTATSWEVPWPVCMHNQPPRYPRVSFKPNLLLAQERDPEHSQKERFQGQIL